MASRRKRKPHNLIPREEIVCMQLRLPKSLHRSLKQAARKNHSSLHAQMLLRLTLPITREEVADRLQQLIFEVITAKVTSDGIQAQRKAPQNGHSAQERPLAQADD